MLLVATVYAPIWVPYHPPRAHSCADTTIKQNEDDMYLTEVPHGGSCRDWVSSFQGLEGFLGCTLKRAPSPFDVLQNRPLQ